MKKRRAALIILLGVAFLASLTVTTLGVLELICVKSEVSRSAAAAQELLLSGGTAIVSFVPERAGQVTVETAETKRTRAPEAEAVLTFCRGRGAAVAVFRGTGAESLEKGAGRATQGAYPNTPGRCVLHGHRDSAFKPLAAMREGDLLLLETAGETVTYTVTKTFVTDPADPAIYEEAEGRQLVLVTCYPFSFVGPAPERFVAIADEIGVSGA